jgi:hypothetical protein
VSQARLIVRTAVERVEAVVELARQRREVLLVFERLLLAVQYPLDARDDCVATAERQLQKFDLCVEEGSH